MVDNTELEKLVNASGFAFQLAIEAKLLENRNALTIDEIIREHPWNNPEQQKSGFIDIIVEKGIGRFVLECKRTKNAKWVFLDPALNGSDTTSAKCYWFIRLDDKQIAGGWSEVGILPSCPESQFCSIRGSGEGNQIMLDRMGSDLIAATEALANEELAMNSANYGQNFIYMPVIVTTAELYVASFNPSTTDISSGHVSEVDFKKVRAVRYKKALSTIGSSSDDVSTISQSNAESERSIFVVNSDSLIEWLGEWNMMPLAHLRGYPWAVALQRFHQQKQEEI